MLNESDTRSKLIDPKLHAVGWAEKYIRRELPITQGRIIDDFGDRKGALKPDYILFLENNFPIAVVEAKDESYHHAARLQQAKRYAQMLNIPFAYATNGHKIEMYDFITKKQTTVKKFSSPKELWERYSNWKFGKVLPL